MLVFKMHIHLLVFYIIRLTYYVAVSAVEQLQVMASKRQYKEAAAQLEVSLYNIIAVFSFITVAF